MAMQMQRAFNSRMMTKITRYQQLVGSYNDLNIWVDGVIKESTIWGVIKAGNKFSQFEEGIALHNEDGGSRTSDYRALYITDKYDLEIEDKVMFNGHFFNVLQNSKEDVFGFNSFILEKSENWKL